MADAELAKTWIELQSLPQNSPEAEGSMWAATELSLLAFRSPAKCWAVVLEIISLTDDEWTLANLAAGPVENLLSMHPDEAIAWIEEEVPRNAKLAHLLPGVWKNIIPDEVWARLKSITR